MKPVARLVFREQGQTSVHVKTYSDLGLLKIDLDGIYTGNTWITLREGEADGHSYEECIKASSIVFYRSEVFNV